MSPPRPCSTAAGTKQQCWWVGGHREPKGAGGWKFGGKKGCREGLAPSSSSPFPSHPLRLAGLNELRRMNYAEHRPLPATPRGSAWALSIHCPAAAAGRGGEKPRSQQRAGWELRPRRPRWVGGGGGTCPTERLPRSQPDPSCTPGTRQTPPARHARASSPAVCATGVARAGASPAAGGGDAGSSSPAGGRELF